MSLHIIIRSNRMITYTLVNEGKEAGDILIFPASLRAQI